MKRRKSSAQYPGIEREKDIPSIVDNPVVNVSAMSLVELTEHIEETHHAYLRFELPRLSEMVKRVAMLHGAKHPVLHEVRRTFLTLAAELSSHMAREEHPLFLLIRQLDQSETTPAFYCDTLANPIGQMELEHNHLESALKCLGELTNGYKPPEWASKAHLAMLDAMVALEQDMGPHLQKENDVLFPRALEMEDQKRSAH